jgi:hypothetical protein
LRIREKKKAAKKAQIYGDEKFNLSKHLSEIETSKILVNKLPLSQIFSNLASSKYWAVDK